MKTTKCSIDELKPTTYPAEFWLAITTFPKLSDITLICLNVVCPLTVSLLSNRSFFTVTSYVNIKSEYMPMYNVLCQNSGNL